jgi:acyl carrier protein
MTALLSTEQIETWMVQKIASALGVHPDTIDVQAPFTEHGLDSVASLQITGELQEELGRELEATLFWEYPSIASLSAFLGR